MSEAKNINARQGFDLLRADYFGGCPECGGDDGYINVHSNHWFICSQHKTAWCAGSNLFSGWKHEGQATWDDNLRMLNDEHFKRVHPVHNSLCNCMCLEALTHTLRVTV